MAATAYFRTDFPVYIEQDKDEPDSPWCELCGRTIRPKAEETKPYPFGNSNDVKSVCHPICVQITERLLLDLPKV